MSSNTTQAGYPACLAPRVGPYQAVVVSVASGEVACLRRSWGLSWPQAASISSPRSARTLLLTPPRTQRLAEGADGRSGLAGSRNTNQLDRHLGLTALRRSPHAGGAALCVAEASPYELLQVRSFLDHLYSLPSLPVLLAPLMLSLWPVAANAFGDYTPYCK
jgi:hypothetical protein